MWMTIAVCTQLKQLWKLSRKKIRLERESHQDPAITSAVLSPVSYPSQLGDDHSWVRIIPVGDEHMDMNMFEKIFCTALKVFYVNFKHIHIHVKEGNCTRMVFWFLDRLSKISDLMNCNPHPSLQCILYFQTTGFVLLYRIFLSHLVVYLVTFGDITWK